MEPPVLRCQCHSLIETYQQFGNNRSNTGENQEKFRRNSGCKREGGNYSEELVNLSAVVSIADAMVRSMDLRRSSPVFKKCRKVLSDVSARAQNSA